MIILSFKRKWLLKIYYLVMLPTVDLQIPMPMYPLAPIYALPPPPPIAIPVPVPFEVTTESTTSTTTTEKNGKSFFVAVPAPYPVPVPMYPPMPAAPPAKICYKDHRPKSCPKCPPCPAYPPPPVFAMPAPVPIIQPPIVAVAVPPSRLTPESSVFSSASSESCSDSDTSDSWRRVKKRRKFRLRKIKWRRNLDSGSNEKELVKPMLSYISENGDVKLRQKLSKDQADDLIRDSESNQNVRIVDSENRENIIVSNSRSKRRKQRKTKLKLRSDTTEHTLGKGNKEIIFKPVDNMRITNLSVAFQVV